MLVHSVIEVDDNVVIDNRLKSETKFRYRDENGVTTSKIVEGYIEPYIPVKPEYFNVSHLDVGKNDVVICKFNPEITAEDLQLANSVLHSEFPDNKVLMIANNLDLLSQDPDSAIKMLEAMIAHIRIVNV